jgi:uncharacterized membrane protein
MDKRPSFLWAFAIGLLFPILQVVIFFLRFQDLTPDASFSDYLFFFITGSLIGLVLIYFLRRSETRRAYNAIIVGFVIGIPLAIIGMLLGGLMGAFGIVLFGMSPAVFVIGLAYLIGKALSK